MLTHFPFHTAPAPLRGFNIKRLHEFLKLIFSSGRVIPFVKCYFRRNMRFHICVSNFRVRNCCLDRISDFRYIHFTTTAKLSWLLLLLVVPPRMLLAIRGVFTYIGISSSSIFESKTGDTESKLVHFPSGLSVVFLQRIAYRLG